MIIFKLPENTVKNRHITKLAFKQRMTPQERIEIRGVSSTDPIVFDFMDLVADATFIDLDREDTQQGVQYLASLGILTESRVTEILTSTIEDTERPINKGE